MASASRLATSKLLNMRNPLLIRRHLLLHPSAVAVNLLPSTSIQSPNFSLLPPIHSSNSYMPHLQLRSSFMARTYVTQDDRDYVDPDDVEDFEDEDEDDDDDDIENYSEFDFDDDDDEDAAAK